MDQEKRVYGVYVITCKVNGRQYVGSSSNVRGRWAGHKTELKHGRHHVRALQADWDEHGRSAFEFRVIGESRDRALRIAMEQAALDAAWSAGLAYNLSRGAETARGQERSPEYRQALSEGAKERWAATEITPEFRERMAAAGRMGAGRPKSAEHRAKLAAAQARAWAAKSPEEARARAAAAGRGNKGKPKSAQARINMAAARRRFTDDQIAEIRRRYTPGVKRGPGARGTLAREFGVHPTTIQNIVNGKGYPFPAEMAPAI